MSQNIEQHILVRNAEAAALYHRNNSELFAYRNFRQIVGDTHNIVDKLKGTPDISVFRQIKTSLLSLMQPTIRIFKVSYAKAVPEPGGSIDSPKVKMVPLARPVYREFKFSNNFGLESAISPNDYLNFESNKATYRNAGIEGIKVSHKGSNYGARQAEIYVNLSLVFKSLKDLAAVIPGEPPADQGGLRFLDLFTYSSQTKKTSAIQTINSRDGQIKFIMGWNMPSDEQMRGLELSEADIKNLKKIENFNLMYSVGLKNYSFSIKEDGRVSFSLDYQSWIDTSLAGIDASVLKTTYRYSDGAQKFVLDKTGKRKRLGEISDITTTISTLNVELQKASASPDLKNAFLKLLEEDEERFLYKKILQVARKLERTGLQSPPKPNQSLIKNETKFFRWFKRKRNVRKLIKQINSDSAILKGSIFKSFVTELMKGYDFPYGSGSRLFVMSAKKEELLDALTTFEDGEDLLDDIDDEGFGQTIEIGKVDDYTVDAAAATRVEKIAKQIEPTTVTEQDISKKLDDGEPSHNFYFFYLGDIIELACRNAGVNEVGFDEDSEFNDKPRVFVKAASTSENADPLKYVRILTGPLEYYNVNGGISRINLAEFPISYNTFSAWFLKEIVDVDNSTISFKTFMNKLMNFVEKLLSNGLPQNFKPTKVESLRQNFTLPGRQTSEKLELMGRTVNGFEELLPKKPIIDIDSADFKLNYYDKIRPNSNSVGTTLTLNESSIRTSFDYNMYHFSTISNVQERNGNPVEDDASNILHLSIGSDRGIVKQIKFSKIEDPKLLDLLVERAKQTGLATEELAFIYVASPDLYGAPFILPGMLFYVNPTLTGLGSPEEAGSVASRLLLGGYFIVGDVEYTIRNSIFRTRIKGLYQGHGKERG